MPLDRHKKEVEPHKQSLTVRQKLLKSQHTEEELQELLEGIVDKQLEDPATEDKMKRVGEPWACTEKPDITYTGADGLQADGLQTVSGRALKELDPLLKEIYEKQRAAYPKGVDNPDLPELDDLGRSCAT